MLKKVLFVTGTRADYGKMKSLMKILDESSMFEVYIFVCGMHLLKTFGSTYKEVQKDNYKNASVYAVGNVQEEIGGFGARSSSYQINPDISISLDVEFASDIPESDKKGLGEVNIGNGLVLKRNTDTNPVLFDYFKDFCKKNKEKYQVSATPWSGGGTNAVSIKYQRSGIATIDIGIPNRYMHTSNEIVSWKDIESGINMLVNAIKSLKTFDFIP